MNWPPRKPDIPGLAIALLALLLGIMVSARFSSASLAHENLLRTLGASSFSSAATLILIVIVTGLVVLKSLTDRRSKVERNLLEAFLEHIPDHVFFKDQSSRFLRINRSMARDFGLADPAQAVNKTDADIFSAEHAGKALIDEQEIIRTGQPMMGIEEKETWPDGHESWVLTTKVPLKNYRGEIIGTMGIAHDITDRKQAEVQIQYMALHDALTGLPNRALLWDHLAHTIALASRNRQKVAVLMLDLDHFKNVNDSLGHSVGDRLLEVVAMRLKACLRTSDIVARQGGDEFVIVLPVVAGNADIEQVAHKVLTALIEPFQIEGQELQIGASIGISQYPNDGESSEVLLQNADAALYEAKRNGRGASCFFTPELSRTTRRRRKLENDLHRACARGEFVIHYQPMVAADSGRITGVEALLRWHHPEEGLILPSQFVPILEELRRIVEVGNWVLKTACLQNAAWQKEGLSPVRIAVNISSQQFYQGEIVETVKRVLRETGLAPQWLELELTESLTLDDSEATMQILRNLKKIGVSLSLDDFGTSWPLLSYLRKFPIDHIKIDRSFIRDISSKSAAETVTETVVNLGHNLGLTCIAEGVQTNQQLEYLRKLKCAEIQGFLYSPALPAADCTDLLRSGALKSIVG